ncbi:RHS repeat-associated core domain-containing protein, partial [Anoxybacteroides rupiense]
NPVMLVDPDGHFVWMAINAGFAAYDGYKAYKSGKGWKGVAVASAFGFVGGGRLKAAKKIISIAYTRRKAVQEAWALERQLIIKTGKGTRRWSNKRKAEIIKTGRAKGFYGHHINSVSSRPDLAGNPDNIRFVTFREHFALHSFNWRNKTKGKLIKRR